MLAPSQQAPTPSQTFVAEIVQSSAAAPAALRSSAYVACYRIRTPYSTLFYICVSRSSYAAFLAGTVCIALDTPPDSISFTLSQHGGTEHLESGDSIPPGDSILPILFDDLARWQHSTVTTHEWLPGPSISCSTQAYQAEEQR